MAAILRSGRTFKPEVVAEVEPHIKIGHVISLHFEISFDVLAQILTDLWLFKNLTYFLISWLSHVTFDLQKL